jgi:UDP-3-O-[3-hydroxymyristoyl] N-acetylglucosamine deacetylase
MRQQRTLRQSIGCAGVGLHSGARVAVTLRPAAEGSGIRFRRVDRPGAPAIAARPDHAVAADGGTSLIGDAGIAVRMVDHLMAALAACGIDNVQVDVSGAELPAMDGSALPFVRLMECAGAVEQLLPAARLEILRPVAAASERGFARLEPAAELVLSLAPGDAAGRPACSMTLSPEACRRDLAGARELGLGGREVAADEASRHCMLDALGALALVPALIVGHYLEHNADASLRCALLQTLLGERGSFRLTGLAPDLSALASSPALRRAG